MAAAIEAQLGMRTSEKKVYSMRTLIIELAFVGFALLFALVPCGAAQAAREQSDAKEISIGIFAVRSAEALLDAEEEVSVVLAQDRADDVLRTFWDADLSSQQATSLRENLDLISLYVKETLGGKKKVRSIANKILVPQIRPQYVYHRVERGGISHIETRNGFLHDNGMWLVFLVPGVQPNGLQGSNREFAETLMRKGVLRGGAKNTNWFSLYRTHDESLFPVAFRINVKGIDLAPPQESADSAKYIRALPSMVEPFDPTSVPRELILPAEALADMRIIIDQIAPYLRECMQRRVSAEADVVEKQRRQVRTPYGERLVEEMTARADSAGSRAALKGSLTVQADDDALPSSFGAGGGHSRNPEAKDYCPTKLGASIDKIFQTFGQEYSCDKWKKIYDQIGQ